MNFEYEATIDDYIEFNLFHTSKSPSLRRQALFARILVGLLAFALTTGLIYIIEHELDMLAIILGIIGCVFLFAISPYISRKSYVRRLRKMYSEGDNKAIIGHEVVSLSPEGIFSRTQAGESKFNWV